MWIDSGLHASEVATAQHAIRLAHPGRNGRDPEMQAIRDNVILVLRRRSIPTASTWWPNGDRRTLGTPYQDSPDAVAGTRNMSATTTTATSYMQAQEETRIVNRGPLYRDWLPQIMHNEHQGTWPAADVRAALPRSVQPEHRPPDHAGHRSGRRRDALSLRARTEGRHRVAPTSSTWYNGSVRTASYFHNIIGILTETGHASATPFTYSSAGFSRELSNGTPTLEPPVDGISEPVEGRDSCT